MAASSVFSFVVGLYLLHRTVDCSVMEEKNDFQSICSRKCEETEEETAEEDFPLYQCSCTQSCSVYGDCCFDSEYKNTMWQTTDFVCISLIGHGKYQAVAGCPPDKPSEFCKDSLGYLPPVTSKTSNITYANAFCAICNGDRENLETWNVELSCSNDKDVPSSETRIIRRFGDIWRLNEADGSKALCMYHVHFDNTSFLEGLDLRSCTNVRKVSECSASWKDLSVMEKCRSYEDPVFVHNTVYQNVHCAECNYLNPQFADCLPFDVKVMLRMGLVDSNVIGFCRTRGSSECIQRLKGYRGKSYSFASLLNINEKACVPQEPKRCCEGESFDYRSQRCKKVTRE